LAEAAVADAAKNARLNGIRNCQFEAGDAAELLAGFSEEKAEADIVALNPPRKGCDEEVLRSCSSLKPKRIIYVSCSPTTLARDLNILKGLGYRTLEIQPVDMFPQTAHVENVALLERENEGT
jgi:23S rRNA (uracil1939-C5)-methyltransferase